MTKKHVLIAILCGMIYFAAQSQIDYSNPKNWAALPFRADAADQVPSHLPIINDSLKSVDVFFIYPTNFMKDDGWNAAIDDATINKNTDENSIKYQATVFNASCQVYAPRYRQANIKAFYTTDTLNAIKAFAMAYQDVKDAFLYYMAHYNQGRPFIIASQSQGTYHARKLLQELIDGQPLQKQLVAAYLVGYPVTADMYKNLQPCSNPQQTGCYEAWYSFKTGFIPDNLTTFYKNAVCINPITWRMDTLCSQPSQHLGMILLNFNQKHVAKVSAMVHDHILWADIDNPLAKKYTNLHIADYNLYWYDIRAHVAEQVKWFLKQ